MGCFGVMSKIVEEKRNQSGAKTNKVQITLKISVSVRISSVEKIIKAVAVVPEPSNVEKAKLISNKFGL